MELLSRLNELFWQLVDLFLHLDRHLEVLVETYGGWSYLLLFVVVFCETGLVVTPFLPGDSLLFGAGALAASTPTLSLGWLLAVLFVAAVLGDTANYWIGRKLGPWLVHREKPFLIRQDHLDKTSRFFERYGGKTIVIARFVPDRPHLRAVRRRPRAHELPAFHGLQRGRRRRLGRCSAPSRATSSATCRSCRSTSRW